MHIRTVAAIGLALGFVGFAGPRAVAAEPAGANIAEMTNGFTFFNRPGSGLSSHNLEVKSCLEDVDQVRSFDEARGGDKDMVGQIMWHGSKVGSRAAALENCMVVRGWRVILLPPAEGAALAALSNDELSSRLATEVGAGHPQGAVVRTWANEAADSATTRFNATPKYFGEFMLSYRVATSEPKFTSSVTWNSRTSGTPLNPKWIPKKALTPATLSLAPPGSGIVLARVQGATLGNGLAIVFERVGSRVDVPPSAMDGDLDTFTVYPFGYGKKDLKDRFLIFALPPGRWRLAAIDKMYMPLNFCLGAPSFEVATGDVLNLGTFDLSAPDLTPDMSLDSPRAFLAGLPQADQVRAATFTNGSRGTCGGAVIYALEFKGAPFMPGYAWGSLAEHPELVVP